MATDQFEVIATNGLNLRSEPEVKPGNIKVTLPKGHRVTKLMEAPDRNWWQVKTSFQGSNFEGFVVKTFLEPVIDGSTATFDLPAPSSSDRVQALTLWSTFYNVHIARDGSGNNPLLDATGRRLGPTLSDRDWCRAALEGTVTIVDAANNALETYNFATSASTAQVDFSRFFPSLGNSLNRTRFKVSKGKFGEGTAGFILVPYRTIAVDRSVIPIGSVIYIPGAKGTTVTLPSGTSITHDGYFFAADVGGAINGIHIDVFVGPSTTNPFSFIKSTPSGTFSAFRINNNQISGLLKALHEP
jgi:3D (Asp-Asp-Asp) domain-containing protein